MKPIQIMIDEGLLAALDSDEEVSRIGRSAVFRMLVSEYLHRRRNAAIADAYKKAYGGNSADLDDGLQGWSEEGIWPDD